MSKSAVIERAIFGQIYSRLVLAATQGLPVYFNDLCPVIFGIQFTRMNKEQVDVIWKILIDTMRVDAKAGRPPLAALYLSRKNESKPGETFWTSYKKFYGKSLSEEEWKEMVVSIWTQYSVQGHK